jgi:hypothetical protein
MLFLAADRRSNFRSRTAFNDATHELIPAPDGVDASEPSWRRGRRTQFVRADRAFDRPTRGNSLRCARARLCCDRIASTRRAAAPRATHCPWGCHTIDGLSDIGVATAGHVPPGMPSLQGPPVAPARRGRDISFGRRMPARLGGAASSTTPVTLRCKKLRRANLVMGVPRVDASASGYRRLTFTRKWGVRKSIVTKRPPMSTWTLNRIGFTAMR